VLLVYMIVPDAASASFSKFLDLKHVLVMNGGRERTIAEFVSALRCRLHAHEDCFQRWLHRASSKPLPTEFEPNRGRAVRFKHIPETTCTTETEESPRR